LNAKIRNTPRQEREYQDILRRQGIVESLYLYLLEKREENAISMGIPVPNAKIIDPANGSDTPISPAPKLIYIAAILLGLCIPAGVISIISFLDKKIQTLEQLENILQMPILGDVPKTKLDKNFIVTDSDRSSIAESFRIIRTNLNYMFSGIDKGSKIIFVTSTIGNEGKTFIAINLASVFSSINKKVLVIGADLRKPKLKEYLKINHPLGLTDLLVDSNLSIKKIIFSHEKFGFDIVTSGQIPPNPSNLLMNNRFQEVLSYGEENYDYIIVDTAPLSLVTDTQIISTHADLFIYVVRANFLDKRLLKNSELSSKLGRIDNKAIILNQSDHKRKGYGYGYGYGS
jgi:capsular exopolysaccharide synthesis family protein